MELYEAILHAKQVSMSCRNPQCAAEHHQLMEWLCELNDLKELQSSERLMILPCKVGDQVYLNTKSYPVPILCSVDGFHFTLKRSYARLYPVMQPKGWLGNQSSYFDVLISQFDKTWFKYIEKATYAKNREEFK